MTKRSLTWIRQHTNVEDLLDDGIENNSDLTSFADVDGASEEVPVPASHEGSAEPQNSDTPMIANQTPVSTFGAVVGGSMMWFGVKLFLFPTDAMVYHARKGLHRGVLEHVTQAGSHVYGVAGFLIGLAVLIVSIYRPRR